MSATNSQVQEIKEEKVLLDRKKMELKNIFLKNNNMKNLKVVKIDSNSLEFNNGMILYSESGILSKKSSVVRSNSSP